VAETVEDVTPEKGFFKDRWVAKGARGHRENRKAKKLYKGKRVWKIMDDF
jgi:ribosome-associated protein YbcJ (S4-like RNA binding protein)